MTGILTAVAGAVTGNPLSVACSPNAVSGVYEPEFGTGITDGSTAAPVGGTGPYTFAWTKVSGADFTLVPSAVSATVAFSFGGASHQVAVYMATVTDHLGRTAHDDVSVTAN